MCIAVETPMTLESWLSVACQAAFGYGAWSFLCDQSGQDVAINSPRLSDATQDKIFALLNDKSVSKRILLSD